MFSPLEQFNTIFIFEGAGYIFNTITLPISQPLILDLYDSHVINMIFPFWFVKTVYDLSGIYQDRMGKVEYLVPCSILWRIAELKGVFILDLIKQQLGAGHYYFFVFIFCIFYGILFLNLVSLLPLGLALTSHIEIMLYVSLSLGLGIFLLGLNVKGINFFWMFIPSCPIFMIPFLVFIEIFSYIIRTFSLAIRLSANIMAGHTLVYIISTFLLKILFFNYIFFLIGLCFLSAVWILEIGVAFLQAYVFTILVLIYINDSVSSSSHH
jgi:ATP synthase subunit 6